MAGEWRAGGILSSGVAKMEPMAGIERSDGPLITDASPLVHLVLSNTNNVKEFALLQTIRAQMARPRHSLHYTFSELLPEATKPRRGKFDGFLIKWREVCKIALSDGVVVLYQSIMTSDEIFSNPAYSNEYTHGQESILSITEANSMQRTRKSRLMGSLFVTFRLFFLI